MTNLVFKEPTHTYESEEPINWISVTKIISLLKQPFDPKQAEKSSKNKKSKWYGKSPEEIKSIWKTEEERSISLGNFYHKQRETEILNCETIEQHGITMGIVAPIYNDDGYKLSPTQILEDNTLYPEHMVYLRSVGACGQVDRVEVANKTINITDYKTNKEIQTKSYVNWEGISKKLKPPVSHLDDCNLIHYTLQLSMYLFMMLKHNPEMKPGVLTLHHVIFEEEESKDQYGYPIHKLDSEGNPIVKTVIPYIVPYMKDEVIKILNWVKENKK